MPDNSYTIDDLGISRLLTRATLNLNNGEDATVGLSNVFTDGTDPSNVVSGEMNSIVDLGDDNIKLDGENKRITISDGTNDRVLIGYYPDLF